MQTQRKGQGLHLHPLYLWGTLLMQFWCKFSNTLTLDRHAVKHPQACCGQQSALVVIFAHDGQVLGLVFVDVP